jgi:hypothetical protein
VSAEQLVRDFLRRVEAVGVRRLIEEGSLSVERVVHISYSDVVGVGYKVRYMGEREIRVDTERGEITVDGGTIHDYDLAEEVADLLDRLLGEPAEPCMRFEPERSRRPRPA